MAVIWTSSSFGYYLISYELKYIKGDFWINGIVSSVSEIIAYATGGILLTKFGIKKVLVASFLISLAGMISLIFYTGSEDFMFSLFVLGGKFGISSAFTVAYCGNVILFPVNILATSFGICNFFARISTISAPYIAELKPDNVPRWTFCVFVFIALLVSFMI